MHKVQRLVESARHKTNIEKDPLKKMLTIKISKIVTIWKSKFRKHIFVLESAYVRLDRNFWMNETNKLPYILYINLLNFFSPFIDSWLDFTKDAQVWWSSRGRIPSLLVRSSWSSEFFISGTLVFHFMYKCLKFRVHFWC